MIRLLFILSLAFIANLAAQEKRAACEQECSSCCPSPKTPVCCECFLPSYYDLQCDTGLFIYGDFLYWYANESNLSPCMTVKGNSTAIINGGDIPPTFVLAPVKINHLGTKWDPGFRVGIGYNFDHDGWDLDANYTWYHNKKRHVVSVPSFGTNSDPFIPQNNQQALIDPWINTTVHDPDVSPFTFSKVSSLWRLQFNQIDLDLGRKFWLGKYSAMRIYAGVRGGWFTTRFSNVSFDLAPFEVFTKTTFSDQFKTKVWGIGLLGGLQPEWHFCQKYFLFANLDAALLWGKFKIRKQEDYSSFGFTGVQSLNYHNTATSDFFKMQAILDIAVGLRWEETWCQKVRTAVDLAWENHIWFDDNNRFKTIGSNSFTDSDGNTVVQFQSYSEEPGNLMMGGPVLRFRIDF